MSADTQRATNKARQIVREYGIADPAEIDLQGIAFDCGAFIRESPMHGADGRLIRRGSKGIISIRQDIREPGQKRFNAGHELGHFVLHKDKSQLIYCTEKAMFAYGGSVEEEEASAFAAELLMPADIFVRLCGTSEPNYDIISQLASKFETSLMATAWRYVDKGPLVCALIICREGRLDWWHPSHDFRFRIIDAGTEINRYSCANDYFREGKSRAIVDEIPANCWLRDDRIMTTWRLKELAIPLPAYGSTVGLIWLPPGSPIDEFEQDE